MYTTVLSCTQVKETPIKVSTQISLDLRNKLFHLGRLVSKFYIGKFESHGLR
jgi:hypothetical protein